MHALLAGLAFFTPMFLSHRENAGAGEAPVPRMAGCGAKASTASGFVDGKPGWKPDLRRCRLWVG